MRAAILTVLGILALTLFLPVILLRIWDRFRARKRGSDGQIPAHAVAYCERFLHADPAAVEREIGSLLSERLVLMYERQEAIFGTY